MIVRKAIGALMAALGLAQAQDAERVRSKSKPPANPFTPQGSPKRRSRLGAYSKPGTMTQASGKRCPVCGPGGHARTEEHRRRI